MRRKGVVLVGLALALVLALVAGACGGEDADDTAASAAAALTEARIGDLVSTMEIMAMSSEVKTGNWETMADMLTAFQESAIPLVAWFVKPDGSYYTVNDGLAEANLADRAYFPRVMSGEVVIGDLVVSRSTGRKAMVAVVPVTDGTAVMGALGISVFLSEMSELTASDIGVETVYAIDGDGAYAMHTDDELITEIAPMDALDATGASSLLLGWSFFAE